MRRCVTRRNGAAVYSANAHLGVVGVPSSRSLSTEQMAKTKCTPKDPGWIKQYQLTVNEIINSLGGDAKVSEKFGEMPNLGMKQASKRN